MKKIISIFSLTIVALALFVFVKPVSAATTITVSAGGSIQTAINTASVGDTIYVEAGTYDESINITKPLTIEGAGPDSTILDSNSLYMVSVEANNVTIKDIAITSPLYNGDGDASGIVVSNAGSKSNLHITNVKIHDIGNPIRVTGNGTQGINIGPVNGLEIDHSEIYNIIDNNADSAALGITMWGYSPSNTANNINIHDNVIHNITNLVLSEGIALTSNSTNVTVNHNIITGPFSTAGIYTSSYMDGPVTITNNTVTDASAYGILLKSPFAQTVKGNTVSGAKVGIQVEATATVAPTINRNSISGNTMGLNNLSSSLVDATCNWWGASNGPGPVGPGSGDTVSTKVNFNPWLTTSNLNGPCSGVPFVPAPTNKDQCKKDEWKTFNNPTFKNQGECVSYVVSNEHAGK
jgi:nitrous oxidase accessory protein NosD